MWILKRTLASLLVSSLGVPSLFGQGDEDPPVVTTDRRATNVSRAALDTAIARGVAHLVQTQKQDGSWGTPAPTFICDVWSPAPSCFETYELAVSGMAVSALLETGDGHPGVEDAIRRGTDYLLANHPAHRVEPGHLYNNWAHAYVLEAFARLLAVEEDEERRSRLERAAAVEVDRLQRYEYVDGGWGYYDFDAQTARPSTGSTSFMTATILVALRMARDQGVEVPRRLVRRALPILDMSRGPDDSFAYSYSSPLRPHDPSSPGVSHKKGSLARTPACLLALQDWEREVDAERLRRSLDDLEEHGHYLLIARKYPFPHETWYQNSGYFCFYGYYYAAMVADRLTHEPRVRAHRQMAARLLPLQEPDGSWWDYQLFGYHKTYGTAYVLMALGRCRASH